MRIFNGPDLEFEEAMYEAFPLQPLPPLDTISNRSQLEQWAKKLFANRSWPEVVGHRLNDGELSPNLSVWMGAFSPKVFDYYVASHLMLASLVFRDPFQVNYIEEVMEAFILPPVDESLTALEEFGKELPADASVERHGANRLDFYRRITRDQRWCIGRFLDLYLMNQREGYYSERGLQLFQQNKRYWLDSSR